MNKYLLKFNDPDLFYPERFTYAKNIREALDNLYREEYLQNEGYTIDKVIEIKQIDETN